MIKTIKVKNFKTLADENLEFKNLTILAGTNSSGKSSLIQSILLSSLLVNIDYISPLSEYAKFLRNMDDLINYNSNSKEFEIIINDDIKLEYLKNNSNKYEIQWTEKFKLDDKLNYKNGNLVYISADRIGARDLYEQNQNPLDKIGIYGEYAISYFENNKREKIENYLIKNKNTPTLEDNLNFWLEEILNTHLETEPIKGTDYIKASFAYLVDKNRKPKFVKPKNIGTGTSFLIAILIACLSAKEGNIIIIENPEIHLHPKAQSKLGKFFAFIANGGVQLIIETHNDHIINRISYEEYSKKLKKDEVVIYYKGDAIEPFEKIEIQNGQFLDIRGNNQFPEGFFDATLQEIFEING